MQGWRADMLPVQEEDPAAPEFDAAPAILGRGFGQTMFTKTVEGSRNKDEVMEVFSFHEFFNIFAWGMIVLALSRLLLYGFERFRRRSVPQALKAVIMIPIAISVALLCAKLFPLPV